MSKIKTECCINLCKTSCHRKLLFQGPSIRAPHPNNAFGQSDVLDVHNRFRWYWWRIMKHTESCRHKVMKAVGLLQYLIILLHLVALKHPAVLLLIYIKGLTLIIGLHIDAIVLIKDHFMLRNPSIHYFNLFFSFISYLCIQSFLFESFIKICSVSNEIFC